MRFLQQAKSNEAFIIYDPNFRDAHLGELETLKPWIIENIRMADLVRGSDEDFRNIFGAKNAQQAYQQVAAAGCPLLVYTKNSQGVEVIASDYSRLFEVPQIQAVSTIGAGDAFNAGIIYALYTLAGSTTQPETFINWGIRFSTDVCESLDNYISTDFGTHITIKRGA
jgi:fructokinase